MLEIIKNKIWELLKDKEVSLVMIFHRDGEILWHRGRGIRGKSIERGEGFCKSYIIKSMRDFKGVEKEGILIKLSGEGGSDSAEYLSIKSLLILPINEEFFVYIDSGNKEFFADIEINSFRLLGELLCEVFHYIRERSGFKEITGKSGRMEGIRDLVLKYSVFFDEISEVPISCQSKLLRFIDTKRYRVLGENREREADVRIIAATNRDLSEAIENNKY